MRPERWKRLEELYHAARERPPGERAGFLEAACQGDGSLRREVEALLGQDAAAEGFIEEPALEQAARELAEETAGAWVGRHVGDYEVLEFLGAGGMGEVYRARDVRLRREVALKVLPEAFSRDARRLARFEREARALAALSHPGIAAIHGLEERGAARFLVLELVEGETLAERLRRARPSVEESLSLGCQIAEALEAAHAKGLVHRDLKPANVMITPDGRAKLLDFGLARAVGAGAEGPDPADAPPASGATTSEGLVLGTAAYMSPEQARGQPVDRRTDVWSFGCVLYELLAGRRAFGGETASDVLVAVLDRDVDWEALPAATPAGIRSLLRRCLRKDPSRRLHDIADARIEIEEARAEPGRGTPSAPAPAAGSRSRTARRQGVIGLVTAAALASAVFWSLRRPAEAPGRGAVSLDVNLPPSLELAPAPFTNPVAVSPDGRTFAFVATSGDATHLFLRGAESLDVRLVPGTEGAQSPFFSPDGRWVGFFAGRTLLKASVDGNARVQICELDGAVEVGYHASWGEDDTIVFTPGGRPALLRVPAAGGIPRPVPGLVPRKGARDYAQPVTLPGTDVVLFTARTGGGSQYNAVTAYSVTKRERRTLIEGGANARFVPPGHLVYSRGSSLLAVAFAPGRLEVSGEPVVMLQDLAYGANRTGYFSISDTGVLAYVPSPEAPKTSLVWLDRKGVMRPIEVEPRSYWGPSLSPDGTRVALSTSNGTMETWILDLARGALTRFTFEGSNHAAVWTPDGRKLVFSSSREGPGNLFWKAADGSGAAERLSVSDWHDNPASWSPDGRVLAFVRLHPKTQGDIWLLHLDGERREEPFLATEFREDHPMISPAGKLLAYVSDESGRLEVYVQPFPEGGRRWLVSTLGGNAPLWARDGRELYYRDGAKLLAVSVATVPVVSFGRPRVLFESSTRICSQAGLADYDVTADGRFLMVPLPPEIPERRIRVVLDWLGELRHRVPAH